MDESPQNTRRRPVTGALSVAAATGVGYFLLASLMWEIDPTWGSAFWPAAGVTFAVLVRSPRAWWPAVLACVAVAELAANLRGGTTFVTGAWGAVANTVEPAVGAAVFVAATGRHRLADLRTLGWLVAAGAVAGPALGAVFGGLVAGSGPTAALTRWVRWFVGDAVGVLAVAPVLLAVSVGPAWRRRAEAGGLVATLAGVVVLLLAAGGALGAVAPYLAVPVLVWAALRFGVFGAALASTAVATAVHAATATGHGAFVVDGQDALVVAQTYIGAVALSMLTVAILVEDVAARRRNEQHLLHRALHDPLTGLANRASLDLCLAEGGIGGVVVVDLDGFKAVNDLRGHAVGDAVLAEVAVRLRSVCRPADLVARVGGDEFVVVLRGIVTDEALRITAERLRSVVAEPVVVAGEQVRVGASVGAVAAGTGDDPASLLVEADRLMYSRKQAGRPAQPPERADARG